MIIRNGRNEVLDLGPVTHFQVSDMRLIAGQGSDGSGGWTGESNAQLFVKEKREYTPHVLPTRTFTCPNCGKVASRYVVAIYCSDTCRFRAAKRASRDRQRANATAAGIQFRAM